MPESEKFFARINASVTGFFSFCKDSVTVISAIGIAALVIASGVMLFAMASAGWMSLNNDIADKKSVETLNKDLADIRAALDMHVQQHTVQPAESVTPYIWRPGVVNLTNLVPTPGRWIIGVTNEVINLNTAGSVGFSHDDGAVFRAK